MDYKILYHPDIVNDLQSLNTDIQKRIKAAIEERLQACPEQYGDPLRKTLKGYWKFRIGDYRLVFKIKGKEIWIYGNMDRKNVYNQIQKRLGWYLA